MNINPQSLQIALIETLQQERFVSQEQFNGLRRIVGRDRFESS